MIRIFIGNDIHIMHDIFRLWTFTNFEQCKLFSLGKDNSYWTNQHQHVNTLTEFFEYEDAALLRKALPDVVDPNEKLQQNTGQNQGPSPMSGISQAYSALNTMHINYVKL